MQLILYGFRSFNISEARRENRSCLRDSADFRDGEAVNVDRKKRNTVLLFGIMIVLSGTIFLLQNTVLKKTGSYALVEVDGKEVARLPLKEDAQICVDTQEEGYNIIKVQDGAVSVTEANCPDKVCVDTGKLRTMGGVIACLPHKLVVTVVGESEDENVDENVDVDGVVR